MQPVPLTKQQKRILRLIKAGHSMAETGRRIGRSRQHVFIVVKRLRELGELPKEAL